MEEWGWHKQATEINRWNHYEAPIDYKATIDGINLHYLHAPDRNPKGATLELRRSHSYWWRTSGHFSIQTFLND